MGSIVDELFPCLGHNMDLSEIVIEYYCSFWNPIFFCQSSIIMQDVLSRYQPWMIYKHDPRDIRFSETPRDIRIIGFNENNLDHLWVTDGYSYWAKNINELIPITSNFCNHPEIDAPYMADGPILFDNQKHINTRKYPKYPSSTVRDDKETEKYCGAKIVCEGIFLLNRDH